jgi:hypothetical protein
MKKRQNNSARASALRITFSVALISAFAILLAIPAPTNRRNALGQNPLSCPTLGNYPNTTISLSTDTTVTPDAPPANTTTINVSTSTNFGGTLQGNPATGVVRVTDAHPAGTYAVTVKAFAGVCPPATKTFTLTVTTPVTCTPVSFAAATNFGTGSGPRSVAVGDFNGDGNQDLAVANYFSANVSILLGDGAGNFSPATNFGAGLGPSSVTVGDFNGDGNQDLAVANSGSANVSIFLGDGTGHFSAPTNLDIGSPISVAVGDFNGDGNQDLAVTNGSNNVSIFLGNGDGTFQPAVSFGAGTSPNSVAVGDFNGDGKQDLTVANTGSNNVSILLGNGDGTFQPAVNFAAGVQPYSVAVGHFNGDGNQDLAVANYVSANVSILLGNGNGTFQPAVNFGAASGPQSVAVGDFNGDGNQDLAVANYGSNKVSILLRNGNGTFQPAVNFDVGGNPYSVVVGDFNGDAKQDLAVANLGTNNVSILLRNCAPTPTPAGSRLFNISTRSFVQTADNVMIGGFIVHGTAPKRVIIRAIGPELGQFGVPDPLADPTLELHDGSGALVGTNDNWQTTIIGGIITDDQVQEIQNSGYAPGDPSESAIIADLPAGNYTAIVRGVNSSTGVGLVEVYDLDTGTPSILYNISTRAFVQTGDNVMIGGFIVHGTAPKRVIIRAIGPELAQFGVPDPLADPTLELHDGTGALIGTNDNWQTTIIGGIITHDQVQEIQNSGYAPGDPSESAIIADLSAGNYTAIVRGVNNTTGVALVEVYDLGP